VFADPLFFFQLVLNGLMVGALYTLIAMGFVLIYKASEVINFAQGEQVMIGGYLALMMLSSLRLPLVLAILGTMAVMALLGFVVERGILRPLTGYPVVSVIMATIGLAAIFRGVAPMVWSAEVRGFPAIVPAAPIHVLGVPLAPINLASAGLAFVCMAGLGYFFQRTRFGIAMRAVSDDPKAAATMGIDLRTILALAWAIAGMVSALGGVIWGRILGVDPQLAIVGLKVFPVVILGGLDSIMGAVVGGFVMGVLENLAAGYIDPLVGGGAKDVVPFIVLIVVLMIRPFGLFGREIIERV
jgi:branched-chain amino acid transport system permease protein